MSIMDLFKSKKTVYNQFGDECRLLDFSIDTKKADVKVIKASFGSPFVHGDVYEEEMFKLAERPSSDPAISPNRFNDDSTTSCPLNPNPVNTKKQRPTDQNLLAQPDGSYYLKEDTGENIYHVYDKREGIMLREAFIKKKGNQWCVFSESKTKEGKHKSLGCYDSLEGAKKRLQQVEYFKHKGVLLGSLRHYVGEPVKIKNMGSGIIKETLDTEEAYIVEYNETGQCDKVKDSDIEECIEKSPVERKAQGPSYRSQIINDKQVAERPRDVSDLGDPRGRVEKNLQGGVSERDAQHNSTTSDSISGLLDKVDEECDFEGKPYQKSKSKLYAEPIGDKDDRNTLNNERVSQTHSRVNDEVGREKDKAPYNEMDRDQDYVRDFDRDKQVKIRQDMEKSSAYLKENIVQTIPVYNKASKKYDYRNIRIEKGTPVTRMGADKHFSESGEESSIYKTDKGDTFRLSDSEIPRYIQAFRGQGHDNPGIGQGTSDIVTGKPDQDERDENMPKGYNKLTKPLKNNGNNYDGQDTDKGTDRHTGRLTVKDVAKHSEKLAKRMSDLGILYVDKALFERRYAQYVDDISKDLPSMDESKVEPAPVGTPETSESGTPEISPEDITESSMSGAIADMGKGAFDAKDILEHLVKKTITQDAVVTTYKRVITNIENILSQLASSGKVEKRGEQYIIDDSFKQEYGMPVNNQGGELPVTEGEIPVEQQKVAAMLDMSVSEYKKFAQTLYPGMRVKEDRDGDIIRGKVQKVDYSNDCVVVLFENRTGAKEREIKRYSFKEFTKGLKDETIIMGDGRDLYGMKKDACYKLVIKTDDLDLDQYNALLRNLTLNDAKQLFNEDNRTVEVDISKARDFGAIKRYVEKNLGKNSFKVEEKKNE